MSHPPTPCPHPERGSAAISIAIIAPVVMALFLALAQAVMVAAARDVALASAEEGLRVARVRGSTPGRGYAAAAAFARREPVLLAPTVAVSGNTTITVTVHGHAPSVLPGVHLGVGGTARGVRERFTTPGQS